MKNVTDTITSLYNQYETFYNNNPSLTIGSAVGVALTAAFFPIQVAVGLAGLTLGHFLADLFDVFATNEPTSSGTTTPEIIAAAPQSDTDDSSNSSSYANIAASTATLDSATTEASAFTAVAAAAQQNLNADSDNDSASAKASSSFGSLEDSAAASPGMR